MPYRPAGRDRVPAQPRPPRARGLLAAACLALAATLPPAHADTTAKPTQQDIVQSEQNPIEALLKTQYRAFAARDAEAMRGIYAEDADWTNAFGRSLSGRDAIVAYLGELFADPNFSDGEMLGEPQVSVRSVGDDAVAVKIYTRIKGQKTVDGDTLPVRHNHSLKLIGRQDDGSWKIVSEMYMDARQETTHVSDG